MRIFWFIAGLVAAAIQVGLFIHTGSYLSLASAIIFTATTFYAAHLLKEGK